jgi:hypothetical protein
MFNKDLELHYGERVSIPKSEVGLGLESWAPSMTGAIHELVVSRLIFGSRLGRAGPVGLQYCLYVGFPCREPVYCVGLNNTKTSNRNLLQTMSLRWSTVVST